VAARASPASTGATRSSKRSGRRWRAPFACYARSRRFRSARTPSRPHSIGRSDMAELFWASMTELARLIATKAVSPVEVVRVHLDRIAALDPGLKAYITVCPERALDVARASEGALMAGQSLGPLHGVPYALKDLYDTAGIRTTGGSRIFAERVPRADATVAHRLGHAGAILLGKLNSVEFAYGPAGPHRHHGHRRN